MPPHTPALDSRAILEQLIRMPTVSRESNLALIAYVRDYLEAHGIASTLIHDETGTKANLLATIGPPIEGGVVLSGHTDVVPVEGQAWTSDPFRLTERDGRLFGRGTADMKSFIAVALAAVPSFLARPLARPIHLAFSYDEEIGCIGVRRLIAHARAHLPKPMAVIVGEPTEMGVVNAHKGSWRFETVVTGLEAHSSQTQAGANAIDGAARLITFLQSLADEMIDRGDTTGRFVPPYSTIQVGMIRGGTAPNIIPRECRFVWEFRILPDAAPGEIIERFDAFAREKVAPALTAKSAEAGVVTRELAFAPALAPERDAPAETLAYRLVGKNEPRAVAFTTEAGLFQAADMSAVVCGPGSIAQAHKPDEYVEIEQIALCEQMMLRLADIVAA